MRRGELLNATLVLDATGGENSFDLQVRNHLDECSNCNAWAKQVKEIETVASSMAQYDVPESLTQGILRAVDAESVQHRRVKSSLLLPAVFAALMAVFFIIETHESVGGIISWRLVWLLCIRSACWYRLTRRRKQLEDS